MSFAAFAPPSIWRRRGAHLGHISAHKKERTLSDEDGRSNAGTYTCILGVLYIATYCFLIMHAANEFD